MSFNLSKSTARPTNISPTATRCDCKTLRCKPALESYGKYFIYLFYHVYDGKNPANHSLPVLSTRRYSGRDDITQPRALILATGPVAVRL